MRPSVSDVRQTMIKIAQCRVETEEQQGVSPSVSDPEDDGTHEWLEDDEAEYQSPEDDGELSFEDTEAAGATPGTVRVSHTSSQTPVFLSVLHASAAQPAAWQDASQAQLSITKWTLQVPADVSSMGLQDQEGNVLMGRFNRPRIMMDMFEYQGTKAAELAGEDYAAANRVRLPHISSLTAATACHLHLEVPDQHTTQALGSKSSSGIPTGSVIKSTAWACMQGAGEAAHSQGMSGEGLTFQQHSRVPLDSQDGEDAGDLCMRCPACPMQAARRDSSHVCSCEMFWAYCPPV